MMGRISLPPSLPPFSGLHQAAEPRLTQMNVPSAESWACGTQGGWESGHATLARRQCFLRVWPLLHSLHMAGGVEKRQEVVGEGGAHYPF